MAASKHTPADWDFLDGLSGRQLTEFRNYMYTPTYITSNAGRFLDQEWIDVPTLKQFLGRNVSDAGHVASSTCSFAPSDSVCIKIEAPDRPTPTRSVKAEPQSVVIPRKTATSVKIRTSYEGNREVLELSSDSEAHVADDSDIEVSEELTRAVSRSSSVFPPPAVIEVEHSDGESRTSERAVSRASSIFSPSEDIDVDHSDGESHASEPRASAEVIGMWFHKALALAHGDSEDSDDELVESDTVWQDPITSYVRTGNFDITQKIKNVKCIEYVSELPSIYPMYRDQTVIVVDLSDPKFNIEDPKTGQLYTVDYLIRNADNDSWDSGGSGSGSSTALVTFVPSEPAIKCRRARGTCRGAFACERIDPKLLAVVRYELDPTSRDAILSAQADTRRTDGTTPEQNAAIFKKVVSDAKCTAVDSSGNKCQGAPMMKAKPGGKSRGHHYFIACSGWTTNFKENHRTHQIPDHVDENLLAKAFADQPLSTDRGKDTRPCSRLVHPTHAHIIDGRQVRAAIRQHPCPATRSIYVPVDRSIRKALIVQNNTGHNHPMPTLTKVSLAVKEIYRECVEASGCIGATVAKVDNAASTKLILKGKTPAAFLPALSSKRAKRDIVRQAKGKRFPNGLDATGAFHLYLNGLTKPLPERYIHAYITTPDGGICILTCVVFLLKLLDDPGVIAFDDDTTYKRVEGEMNEWEVTVYAKVVLRAASVVRAYINRTSADFFEQVFDELQRVKLLVTGRPIPLKRFVPGGNLQVMNADMDGAQIIGICRSVMKHNVPEYSKIPNDTPPEKVAPEFIKICWRHSKEPVHDFKSLVSSADYERLLDFVYIDSKEALDAFSAFVKCLGIKKIQDWWAHKEINEWIIPCLVKSQSRIPADVWDSTPSTTNTNEAQHHWTNSQTGIKLTCVEAIESAYVVDQKTADEIQTSMRTGILTNAHNEVAHRMARNSQRQSNTAQRARESRQQIEERRLLEEQLAEELETRRQSSARTKDINAQLKVVKSSSKKGRTSSSSAILSASSSGRVKTATGKSARKTSSGSGQGANPSNPVIIEAPEPAGPAPSAFNSFELGWDCMFPAAVPAFTSVDGMRSQAFTMSEANFIEPATADFLNPELYSAALTMYPDAVAPPPALDLPYDLIAADLNSFFGFDSGFSSDIPSTAPADIAYANSSESPLAETFFDTAFNFYSTSSFASPLPSLPPPPAESPCGSSPAPENLTPDMPPSHLTRARRSRLDGLEPTNILAPGSSRSRAPSSRKRDAEENISEQPKKKRRAGKLQKFAAAEA
ncbi:hypothetical protein B0H10DRAFT_1954453 [Mycena sp. CBHHK59/15]|nr:hypothetical protein B0H10DRAFT_2333521 [Mycena sp. CBHHK59/15]KAJ6609628.1 hypothetical protein B0H10DRAFT_1954453 [Mycena sp. CBHHK59/15]